MLAPHMMRMAYIVKICVEILRQGIGRSLEREFTKANFYESLDNKVSNHQSS